MKPYFVQVMAWLLFFAKLLSEPVLAYIQMDRKKQISLKIGMEI